MLEISNLIRASVKAGRGLLWPPPEQQGAVERREPPRLLVPIRSLGENHRQRIELHLLALSDEDRYMRFGYTARDSQIERYVAQLDFERDEIFGIYNRSLALIAMAHLALPMCESHANCAEFGVSVSAHARGRGLGARLFERAALNASNAGIELMFIHALSKNAAMLNIARKAGAKVERDGDESEAFLKLPAATFDTRVTELIGEQVAQIDYRIKTQAKQFWSLLENLQAQRARHSVADKQDDL